MCAFYFNGKENNLRQGQIHVHTSNVTLIRIIPYHEDASTFCWEWTEGPRRGQPTRITGLILA